MTFHNEDTGFCVLRVEARGHRDVVTVVGHAAAVGAGEVIQASGEWVNNRSYGPQFRARFLRVAPPSTAEGIEKYLASGMVKGIGPVYARTLTRTFGEKVFDIMEAAPERLPEVSGIGPKRAERIVTAWSDQKAVREIMIFPHANGVGTSRAVRIYKTYGADAIQVISENPYRLARDIRGIGFRTADAIANKVGIGKTAMVHLRAGISYALGEATNDGHCGLPRDNLRTLARKLLEIPGERIKTALELELAAGDIVADGVEGRQCVFLVGLHRAEQVIAGHVVRLARGAPPWPDIDTDKAITWPEQQTGLDFAASQQQAIHLALSSKVLVVTGGPGVGKTTLINAILRVLAVKGVSIALCAPTGRAAKRMSEATGRDAKTIHRLLEVNPRFGGFKHDAEMPLDCDLLVADETSMIDVPLMQSLLRAVPDHAALLLVGDIDQLPSVGPGQVLAAIIGSGTVPVVRLTEVFRQAAQSRIITNAHRINRGELPDLRRPEGDTDFYFVETDAPEDGPRKLLEIVSVRIPRRFGLDPIRDCQVLCPMNRGVLGARSLNLELQQALNGEPTARVEKFGWTYVVSDKVMKIENDYDKDVYNGDLGFIVDIREDDGVVSVDFDGRDVVYEYGELDRLALAYATTIHKSQGSEYPAVIIPITTQHYPMLQRNLLYTGVTRGRKLVVLLGQRKAVAMAIKGVAGRRRWSKLHEWLAIKFH